MTNAELAILMLVAEAPRHGYEIEQVIEQRGMRNWTEIGFSSIYYILNKLEKKGYLESRPGIQSGRGPAPKVYTITQAGLDVWRKGVREALANPTMTTTSFMIGLANLPALPPEEALEAIRSYYQALTDRRIHVVATLEKQRPLPPHVEALFDYSLTLLKAELDWLSAFISQQEQSNGKDGSQKGVEGII